MNVVSVRAVLKANSTEARAKVGNVEIQYLALI
jgi:hypothetical protein